MCGSRSDLVHRGDLAADELCGGHYDKEKKIWSLPRGILALLKAFLDISHSSKVGHWGVSIGNSKKSLKVT